MVDAYVRRALTHCSGWSDVAVELDRATQVLSNNGYSSEKVHRAISRHLNKWYGQLPSPQNQTAEPIKLYYKGVMSTAYKTDERVLRDIIQKNVAPTNSDQQLKLIIYYKN